jgi:hypothetical protein
MQVTERVPGCTNGGDPHRLRQGARGGLSDVASEVGRRRVTTGLDYLHFCSLKCDLGPIGGRVTCQVQRQTRSASCKHART